MEYYMDRVNVGLIGLGYAGTCLHLPPLKQNAHVNIEVACDEDVTKTEGFRHNHGDVGAHTTARWEDVINDASLHAIFIATPTPTHREIATAALKAGKHVFCEKPVALSMEDAQAMYEAAQNSGGKLLMIGQVLRYWPDYVEAHNIVKCGKLGEIRVARTSRCVGMPSGWYGDELQSGGVILDLALHDIDFLVWTLGLVDSVFAQGENCLGKGTADFVDYAQIHLNFQSGAVAHLEASWAVPPSFPFTTSLEMCGTNGMLQMDNGEQSTSIELFPPSCAACKSGPIEYNGYFFEIDAFIKAILNGAERAPIDVMDVMHPLEVAMAAKASIRSGKTISLKEPVHGGKCVGRLGDKEW
jgi:UDP-N-acetylglucosamine 3-dehydrogenase